MNLKLIRELPPPEAVKAQLPVTAELAARKASRDGQLRDILSGRDSRFLLIVGPCSADRQDAVMDYNLRLCKVQEQVADKIFIIPRIYTNKPRTTGDGYKGMIHQPDPEAQPDMY